MATAQQWINGVIGVASLAMSVWLFRLSITGTHSELSPPRRWEVLAGGLFETTRSRRVLWFSVSVVSFLVGLLFTTSLLVALL